VTWGCLKEEIVLSLMEQGVGEEQPTVDLRLEKLGTIAKFVIQRIHSSFLRDGYYTKFLEEQSELVPGFKEKP
jgi:hypothetical protein